MATGTTAASPDTVREEDQRVFLHDVSWPDFELLLKIRGDRAGVRMTYLNRVLELMSPSGDHEVIKKMIARLLEMYALETGIALNGFGSWTLKSARRACSVEPDECYSVGTGRPTRPDLAIEVIWTSGGIDKLEVYRGLGVGEVWMWREGAIEVYVLVEDAYLRRERSDLFASLDLVELARHVDGENQTEAIRRYRETLRR